MTSVPANANLPPSSAQPVAPASGAPAQGLGPADTVKAAGTPDSTDGGDPCVRAITADAPYPSGVPAPGKTIDYFS
jgi:hypothetical protein